MIYEDYEEVMEDIKECILNEKLDNLIAQLDLEDKFEQLSALDDCYLSEVE